MTSFIFSRKLLWWIFNIELCLNYEVWNCSGAISSEYRCNLRFEQPMWVSATRAPPLSSWNFIIFKYLMSFADCVNQDTCEKCLDQHSSCVWCTDRVSKWACLATLKRKLSSANLLKQKILLIKLSSFSPDLFRSGKQSKVSAAQPHPRTLSNVDFDSLIKIRLPSNVVSLWIFNMLLL